MNFHFYSTHWSINAWLHGNALLFTVIIKIQRRNCPFNAAKMASNVVSWGWAILKLQTIIVKQNVAIIMITVKPDTLQPLAGTHIKLILSRS